MAVKSKKDRISKMIGALKKVADGDYSVKLDISARNDEIDSLADAINKTIEKAGKPIAAGGQTDSYRQRQDSGERYRSILENMEEVYLETDLKGNYIFFNDALCRVLGYSRAELTNNNYRRFSPPGTEKKKLEIFNEVYRTGKKRTFAEYTIMAKDGSSKLLEMSIALLRSPSGEPTGFGCVGRDVTEKIEAEKKIKDNERHLRLITENIHEVIWTMDFDLRFTYISPSVSCISSFTPEEIIQKMPLKDILPPETFTMFKNMLTETLAEEESGKVDAVKRQNVFEVYLTRKKGGPIWLEISANFNRNENGRPFEILGIARDITKRKETEEALLESEKRYRMIVDNSRDSIWTMDLNLNFTYLSPSIEKLTGYTLEEFKQIPLHKQLTPASMALVEKIIVEEFAPEESRRPRNPNVSYDIEVENIRKDGSLLWEEVIVSFNRDENGKPLGILGVSRDISERKKAQAAIQASEERYRLIAENMDDVIWTIGLDLRFIYISPSCTHVTGYTPEEAKNMSINELLTPASYAYATKRLAEELALEASGQPVDRQRYITIEVEAIHKEGHTFWLEISGTFIRNTDDSIKEILVVGRNITGRKKVEIALQESEKRYRMIAENMSDIIWTIDFNLQFIYVSPSNSRITGYTAEEMRQIPLNKILSSESFAQAQETLSRELAAEAGSDPIDPNRSRTLELEVYHKNGPTVWLEITATFNRDENGKAMEILAVGRNITERRRIEKALEESEQRYRMIVENMHDLVWTMDFDMNYQYVSPSETRVTGYTPQEVMSSPLEQQITAESYARALAILAEELEREQNGEPADPHRNRIFDVEMNCKDGSTAWAEITATFDRDEKGKAVGIMMIGKDISERKKAQEEKDKLEQQLIQAQKMETIGRLAGGVAHDFNNMLNVILGYAELTKLRLPADSELTQYILEIEKAACRSRDITSQLLAFSRKQIIAPKMINLNKLIAQSQKSIARLIGEDIDLNFFPGNDLSMVSFDPSQFEQILMNMAVNARDAMPDGGKLTMETSNIHLDATYCQNHLEFTPGHYVLLAVSDNGIGMEKDILQSIFEPFFTTKEVGKGTGLGLATVFGIVKQHEGFINVYSEPGQGSTFKIYLPASTATEETTEEIPREELTIGTGTILLVEDDDMLRSMITQMLEMAGYSVIATANPQEALPLCENNDTRIDLLITDVVMPGMNGRELRDRIKIIRPDVKVLFMSGYTSNVIVHHGVLEQGVNFLQKPFSMNILARKVGEMIDSR
jgi:two-component system cell cycle sensor histidine kinase/response regulator CckA